MDDAELQENPTNLQHHEITLKLPSGDPPFTISILRLVVNPSIHTLLQDDFLHRRVFFSKRLSTIAPESSNAYFVQVIDQLKTYRTGILFKCLPFPHTFELFVFARADSTKLVNSTSVEEFASLSETSCIEGWTTQPNSPQDSSKALDSFSMKPPAAYISPTSNRNAVVMEISPQSETNPIQFLQSRYYSILYSLSTPLTYFPKTTLTRLQNMCCEDKKSLEESLLSVYLNPEELNERHRLRYGVDTLIGKPGAEPLKINQYESENQEFLLQKYYSAIVADETRDKVVFDLKRREAQLQILVIMQLLLAWKVDEDSFLKTNSKQQEKLNKKLNKRSLVRKKSKTKKIIPTFLGVGIQETKSLDTDKRLPVTQFTLYTSLVALVDQMSIWDVITGKLKNKKDESMYGFLAYVFVPFFNSSYPGIVKFVIEKVKELRPNFKVPRLKSTRKKSEADTEASSPMLHLTSSMVEESTLPNNAKPSRFNKTLLSKEQKPFLRRAKTSISEGGDEPAFLLKRSKSNLGSKNLKRRQVDMSLTKSEEQIEAKPTSFIFCDARKMKLLKDSSKSFNEPKDIALIQATPTANRVADVILETPHDPASKLHDFIIPDSTKKGSVVQQKLSLLAAPFNADIKILSSPVNNSSEKSPNIFLHNPNPNGQGPSSIIASSPIQPEANKLVVTENSEQISAFKNPFTQSSLQGSPCRPTKTRKKAPKRAVLPRKAASSSEVSMPITKPADINVERSSRLLKTSSAEFSRTGDATDVDSADDAANDGNNTDSDSDSDFEKLLASTSNRTLKTYVRPKRR